jgi:hypothetical protein
MKLVILCTLLSSISLAAVAQSDAPSGPASSSATSSETQSVTIGAMSPKYDVTQGVRQMSPDEFGKYTGSYDLSNGKSLSLFSRGLKKYAVIQGEARHEIVATRGNTFVSTDKQLKMTIDKLDNGDAKGELLIASAQPQTDAPPQPVAQVSPRKSSHMVAHATPMKSKQKVAHVATLKTKQVVASL